MLTTIITTTTCSDTRASLLQGEGATFVKIPLETISLWLSIRDMFIETDCCEMSPRCIYLNTKMWKPREITVADKYVGFSRVSSWFLPN